MPSVPDRNWRKWGLAYIAHAATGALSGAGVGAALAFTEPAFALSFLLSVLVMVRQTVEYLRRYDTPGRDLGDHIVGWVAAYIVVLGGVYYYG